MQESKRDILGDLSVDNIKIEQTGKALTIRQVRISTGTQAIVRFLKFSSVPPGKGRVGRVSRDGSFIPIICSSYISSILP